MDNNENIKICYDMVDILESKTYEMLESFKHLYLISKPIKALDISDLDIHDIITSLQKCSKAIRNIKKQNDLEVYITEEHYDKLIGAKEMLTVNYII